MRTMLAALGLLMLTPAMNTAAVAVDYPWCALYGSGNGGTNCGFVTIEQCRAAIFGNGGYCQPNTMYQPDIARSRKRR